MQSRAEEVGTRSRIARPPSPLSLSPAAARRNSQRSGGIARATKTNERQWVKDGREKRRASKQNGERERERGTRDGGESTAMVDDGLTISEGRRSRRRKRRKRSRTEGEKEKLQRGELPPGGNDSPNGRFCSLRRVIKLVLLVYSVSPKVIIAGQPRGINSGTGQLVETNFEILFSCFFFFFLFFRVQVQRH